MSDQYVLSRRKAIALFGISAAGIAAEANLSDGTRPRRRTRRRSAARRVHSTFLVTAHWCSANHAWEPRREPNSLPR